jgi:hypothetical protein
MTEMERSWYWTVLGLDAGSDERTVKRAYARQLKTTRPDEDIDAFQRLRTAYEHALDELRYRAGMQIAAEPVTPVEPAPLVSVPEHIAIAPTPAVVLPVQRAINPAAVPSPDMLARAAWDDFLATRVHDLRDPLAAMRNDERLHSFEARETFELLALHHAASAACPAPLRAALIAHYEWNGERASLLRYHHALAQAMFSRHAADVGWSHLLEQAQTDPLLEHLVQDTVPNKLPQRWNRHFVHAMRATLASIRWQHPHLLEHRMNQDVFNWWEAQVADKKYFRQTAGWSIVAGVGLWALVIVLMHMLGIDVTLLHSAFTLGICEAVAIGTLARFTLHPPEKLLKQVDELQVRWFGQPLLEKRHALVWQVGWMPPFAVLSLGLLVPAPHPLLSALVALGLSACAAMAILSASVSITCVRFCIAFGLAFLLAILGAGLAPGAGLRPWSLLWFGLSLFTVFFTPGEPLYRQLGWNDKIVILREGWMALGLAACVASLAIIPLWLHTSALMLMMLTGVMIARYNAGMRFAWAAMLLIAAVTGTYWLNDPRPLQTLVPATLLVAYFMTSHLFSGPR